MRCLYTPSDIAVYFLVSDLLLSDEKRIIDSLWEQQQSEIINEFRTSKRYFRNSVYNEMTRYTCNSDELDELDLLMQDMEYSLNDDNFIEQSIIESFFKIIKLELAYTPEKDYRKVKLRTLIRRFGYKRRSENLINSIDEALKSLGLITYLKGHIPCNIAEIKLDDTVIIRLEE